MIGSLHFVTNSLVEFEVLSCCSLYRVCRSTNVSADPWIPRWVRFINLVYERTLWVLVVITKEPVVSVFVVVCHLAPRL
jgi:hypothetical protein